MHYGPSKATSFVRCTFNRRSGAPSTDWLQRLRRRLGFELSKDFNESHWNMPNHHFETMRWLHSFVPPIEGANEVTCLPEQSAGDHTGEQKYFDQVVDRSTEE